MNVLSLLKRAVSLHGNQSALSVGEGGTTYRDLAGRVAVTAKSLRGLGADPGDRVACLLPNGPAYLELYFAAAAAGIILVPLNVRLTALNLRDILRHADVGILLAHHGYDDLVEACLSDSAHGPVLVRVDGDRALAPQMPDSQACLDIVTAEGPKEDAPVQIYYTSGTTGQPKGVVLTHRNVCHHALMAVAELGLSDRDTWLHAAPMFHLADAWAVFAVTWVGGRHLTVPRFEPDAVLDALSLGGVTLTNLIPTMLGDLVAAPGAGKREYPDLRLLLSGGAPISPKLVRQVMETFGCEYMQTYGLTETSPYLTLSRLGAHMDNLPDEERFWYRASTGRPMLGVEVRVVDERGRDVPADRKTVGEIVARGPSVSPGYWKDPKETARVMKDGWFHTGDLAVRDPEGYVDIVDRKKDIIVTGGELVYSVEVENVLAECPGVGECAVIAVPHERWGEAVAAVVVLRKAHASTEEEILAFCRTRLARFKVPKSVLFCESLPRLGSGKISKRVLREPYWQDRTRQVH